jgi:hypothetical protein
MVGDGLDALCGVLGATMNSAQSAALDPSLSRDEAR